MTARPATFAALELGGSARDTGLREMRPHLTPASSAVRRIAWSWTTVRAERPRGCLPRRYPDLSSCPYILLMTLESSCRRRILPIRGRTWTRSIRLYTSYVDVA